MSKYGLRAIALTAVFGVVLTNPSSTVAQPARPAPALVGPGTSNIERMLKPDLSCAMFFATDDKGANKISTATVVEANPSLKHLYLFYSFKNSGKGNAVNVPVNAIVGGSVTVPQAAKGQETSLANAYCPNENCKFPGKINLAAGATSPAVKAAEFTILPPSDVLSRPLFKFTTYAYVVMHAKGTVENKACTDAQNYSIHYKK